MSHVARRGACALAVVALTMSAVAFAQGNRWSDRTILTFSAPVMIPGATLPPGKYVFELADLQTNRHVVTVRSEETQKQVTVAQAVPMKRLEPTGDVVVQFDPTEPGSAPAIRGWYPAGSLYGHEFVYPEAQARAIANRTKTLVLSTDAPGSGDVQQGALVAYDAEGRRSPYKAEAQVEREWREWQQSRAADTDPDELKKASAPMVRSNFQGTRVELADLEENPTKYMNQTVSVDAEIDTVYGPRVFTIDEPRWSLGGEMFVLMPSSLAALVKEDDRVTVTGKVQPFVVAEFEREWGWVGIDSGLEVELSRKPVLVASRVVGGDNDTAMFIELGAEPAIVNKPVATSGKTAALTTGSALGAATDEHVGRQVTITAAVTGNSDKSGFFIETGGRPVFVLPSQIGTTVAANQKVTVSGVLLRMPTHMLAQLDGPANLNDEVYIYANTVKK